MKATLASGTVHRTSSDMRELLHADASLRNIWQEITPLARNEWICLIISAKKTETRVRRLERMRSQLLKGQRRPCCWQGCPHREKTGS